MFTAGRYEYRNKGVDMFIESLARTWFSVTFLLSFLSILSYASFSGGQCRDGFSTSGWLRLPYAVSLSLPYSMPYPAIEFPSVPAPPLVPVAFV